MKIAVVLAGAVMAFVLTGPAVLENSKSVQSERVAEITVPAWLQLPSTPFISSIEYSGEVGAESSFGTISYDLPSNGAAEVVWLREHLSVAGYVVDDCTSAIDNFAGADVVMSALHPATGRRVSFVKIDLVSGSTLRVTFEDPLAGTKLSDL